jgi:hypothetical protein
VIAQLHREPHGQWERQGGCRCDRCDADAHRRGERRREAPEPTGSFHRA